MDVSLYRGRTRASRPAMTTPITAASAVAIAAIHMHGVGEDFTGGVPRLPRWQPAHTSHHRWLVIEMVDARGCQPVEAGLGIGPDG